MREILIYAYKAICIIGAIPFIMMFLVLIGNIIDQRNRDRLERNRCEEMEDNHKG